MLDRLSKSPKAIQLATLLEPLSEAEQTAMVAHVRALLTLSEKRRAAILALTEDS